MSDEQNLEKFASALQQLAKSRRLPLAVDEKGARCLKTAVGDLCILPVLNRSEIEVWLETREKSGRRRIPLPVISKALGDGPTAIVFNPGNISGSLETLLSLVTGVVDRLDSEPDWFLSELENRYSEMVSASLRQDKKREASALWDAGDFNSAAAVYRTMDELSDLERKRLHLVDSGKYRCQ